ncbi:tyrosine-type recombinase/integrase [Amycolatopsis pigmentata]|uniref:Tyrosine-type recombinase/integrase n=1 Tax=Amycolatopsis pigmentata TaxID=450801 RepID=A0ABW5FWN8_9PSEU
MRPSWIGERFAQHIAAAGLPPIRLHDCRHTAATMLLAIGTDIKVVQRMFGHSTRSTTSDIYTSVLNELLAEAAGSLAALIPRRHAQDGRGNFRTTLATLSPFRAAEVIDCNVEEWHSRDLFPQVSPMPGI